MRDIPRQQRQPPGNWSRFLVHAGGDRDSALHAAYTQGGLTMTLLAAHTGLSISRVSRIIAAIESISRPAHRAPAAHSRPHSPAPR